jgi:hypothetical protein
MHAPAPRMMLQELQRGFAEAIFSLDAPIPPTIMAVSGQASFSRFGVYRNNVIASLIGAVGARYPACRRLLWPDSFDGAARLYVMSEPPRSPVLLHYGDSFPQFLRRIGEGASTDYAADLAELETARVRAYHAAEGVPVPAEALQWLLESDPAALRIGLHPSVNLVRSRFPIVSAWAAHLQDDDDSGPAAWLAESALIVRPESEVEVWRLPAGGYAFFSAIAGGETVAQAAVQAMTQEPAFDLAACFGVMMSARVAVRLSA